jgi:formate dehydrogenase subunit delta
MSSHQLPNLILMANQIAANITSGQSEEVTAAAVTQHLSRFWSRAMKAEIVAYLNEDGSELSETAKLAVSKLEQAA